MSAIDDKYNSLGGPGGWLGRPIDAGAGNQEMNTADNRGRCRDYEHGSIYWSSQTGAHEVHGDIRIKWARLGGVRSFLRFPTTDELGTPDGRGRFKSFRGRLDLLDAGTGSARGAWLDSRQMGQHGLGAQPPALSDQR